MEYQVNIFFILVFCFSIVEPIPYSEEGSRYGAHQPSNWPKNPNQPRQNQNYPRPQNFYPSVNYTNNRNNNQDYRLHERSYDNRHSTMPQWPGERRSFHERPNGRNRPNYQPVPIITNGFNLKDKSLLDEARSAPPPYRPTKHYDFDDRNNGRYSPQTERNYQQPMSRPYYAAGVPYQKTAPESSANRYREFTPPQRPTYFNKQITPQNGPALPVDFDYSAQNRIIDPTPENFIPSLNVARFIPPTPDVPATPQSRPIINKILSDPKIQKYLKSNHKKYLVLHSDGTVEHVDNLDSIVQNYPNYVIVKAGDIINNPKDSFLEFTPPTPREESLTPKITEIMNKIPINQNDSPEHGYNNPRVLYVTEKVYAQPISRPVNILHEDDAISNDDGLVILTTPDFHTITNFIETSTEYYDATPFAETTTVYDIVTPLFENNTEFSTPDSTINYEAPSPLVEIKTEYKTYPYSNSESTISSIPITVEVDNNMFTEIPIEILSEAHVTDAPFLVTTEDYSTLESTANYPNHLYLDSDISMKNNIVAQKEMRNDIIPKLRDFYSTGLGIFLRQHLDAILPGNNLNTATDDQNGRRLENEVSTGPVNEPFNVTDLIDAISELTVANMSTTEKADVLYSVNDFNTSFPLTDDLIYTTPMQTSSLLDLNQTAYLAIPLTPSDNIEVVNVTSLNPFLNTNNEQPQSPKHKIKHHHPEIIKNPEYSYHPLATDDDDSVTVLYTTTEYINPFTSFSDLNTEPPYKDDYRYLTETEFHENPNPFIINEKEAVKNPFVESTTAEILRQHRRIKNKKRFKLLENYNELSTNPFIAQLNTESSMSPTEEIYYNSPNTLNENEDESIYNPFLDTNPFMDTNTFIKNESDDSNSYTENYSYEITPSKTETPVIDDTPQTVEELENQYLTNIVPLAYLPPDNGAYELTATPIPEYYLNAVSDDFNDFSVPVEEMTVSTTTEKSAVWFKMDADIWTKLSNGTIPYDVVYFFQVHAQPVVEKDTKTTIFPNGTIVQEFTETVWEREGDPAPILVKSTKTVYPDEEEP